MVMRMCVHARFIFVPRTGLVDDTCGVGAPQDQSYIDVDQIRQALRRAGPNLICHLFENRLKLAVGC